MYVGVSGRGKKQDENMLKGVDVSDGRPLEPENSLSMRYLTGCRSI